MKSLQNAFGKENEGPSPLSAPEGLPQYDCTNFASIVQQCLATFGGHYTCRDPNGFQGVIALELGGNNTWVEREYIDGLLKASIPVSK